MRNPTKYCELTLVMNSGVKLRGTYHVPVGMDNQMRPADALRKLGNEFILLCDVTVSDQAETQQAILVRSESISYIELPPTGWSIRDVQDDPTEATMGQFQSN